jgi:hypothetical protein
VVGSDSITPDREDRDMVKEISAYDAWERCKARRQLIWFAILIVGAILLAAAMIAGSTWLVVVVLRAMGVV